MSSLSLSNCHVANVASDLWVRPMNDPSPALRRHSATTCKDERNHDWMVVTGGLQDEQEFCEFHAWALNLTHVELENEEEWIRMNMTNAPECAVESEVPKDGERENTNLWSDAENCAPTARYGHESAVVDDCLYIFGGYNDFVGPGSFNFDPHVYRISVKDILSGQATPSSWERILPQVPLSAPDTAGRPLRGGLWQERVDLPPKMVVFVPSSLGNYLWTYDFAIDSWDSAQELVPLIDMPSMNYHATIIQDSMYILAEFKYICSTVLEINLSTKSLGYIGFEEPPRSGETIIGYRDASSKENVLVRFGGGSNFEIDSVVKDEQSYSKSLTLHGVERPQNDRTQHSAVLSNGRMYIFGGNVSPEAHSVWSIDVGSDACGLPFDSPTSFTGNQSTWRHEHNKSDDTEWDYTNDDEATPMFSFIFFWILVLMAVLNMRGQRTGETSQSNENGNDGPVQKPQILDREGSQRVLDTADDTADCSICLLAFSAGNVVRELPCGHCFHKDCVDDWLTGQANCPLCRTSARLPPPGPENGRYRKALVRLGSWARSSRQQIDIPESEEAQSLSLET